MYQAISLKTPVVPKKPLAALPKPIDFAVSKWRILRFPERLGFGIRTPAPT
jgi:hypothetical protein